VETGAAADLQTASREKITAVNIVIAPGRRQKILELLEQQGNVKVEELAGIFDVSQVTIRKDLAELEEQGMLQRDSGRTDFCAWFKGGSRCPEIYRAGKDERDRRYFHHAHCSSRMGSRGHVYRPQSRHELRDVQKSRRYARTIASNDGGWRRARRTGSRTGVNC